MPGQLWVESDAKEDAAVGYWDFDVPFQNKRDISGWSFSSREKHKICFLGVEFEFDGSHYFRIALPIVCRWEVAVSGSECETNMVRSSAYAMIRAEKGKVSLRRSSMRMIQRKAERTDRCGHPVEMLTMISDELQVNVSF